MILNTLIHQLLAQLFANWWVIPLAIAALYLRSPAGKGALGEAVVNLSAKLLLDREQYHLIRNVTLPTENGTTQIDHIIVSRFGVFVIETKNYAGWIFGTPQQKMWTQKFPRRSQQFQNPLHQNFKHVRTLIDLLQLESTAVHSLIVFVGSSTFKTPMPANVTAAGGYLRFIKSKTEPLLTADQVRDITLRVQQGRLAPSLKTDREHVRHVKEIVEKKRAAARLPTTGSGSENEAALGICPKCGNKLVRRTIKTGARAGQAFVGCNAFPACRFLKLGPDIAGAPDQRPVAPPHAIALPSAERSQ